MSECTLALPMRLIALTYGFRMVKINEMVWNIWRLSLFFIFLDCFFMWDTGCVPNIKKYVNMKSFPENGMFYCISLYQIILIAENYT